MLAVPLSLLMIFLSVSCMVIHVKNFFKKSDEREFGLIRHILGFVGCLFGLVFGLAVFSMAIVKMRE